MNNGKELSNSFRVFFCDSSIVQTPYITQLIVSENPTIAGNDVNVTNC